MLWSVVLLVVCLLLAASVFLVAGAMDNPGGVTSTGLGWERLRAAARHLRAQREGRIPGRAVAVAHHAVGAPTVWVGRRTPPAGQPRPERSARPARTARPVRSAERPVDMGMDAFFAATIEAKPAYVEPAELTDALQRARVQATRTLYVPLGTIARSR